MKVKEANSGLLCNFEVLNLLRSRGASQEALASVGSVTSFECKVYDYLSQTAAGTQTRETLQKFFREVEQYALTKAERLQVANLRPSTAVEVHLIVEDCEERFSSEKVNQFVEIVGSCLPPPPNRLEEEDKEGMEVEDDDNDQEDVNEELNGDDEELDA